MTIINARPQASILLSHEKEYGSGRGCRWSNELLLKSLIHILSLITLLFGLLLWDGQRIDTAFRQGGSR